MTILVELKNISKSFGSQKLLDNVSFNINKGEVTTLIGPNGSGKTTLAKLILGLEKPCSGLVKLDKDTKVGYVPQQLHFDNNFPCTVESFIAALAPNSIYNEEHKALMEFAKLEKLQNNDISMLSGGQLQKLLLMTTLLHKPDLIILDEPIQYLDINSQQEFYKLIEYVKKNFHITIFMISHDLFTVMKNSDQVICLNGHVCCSGKPGALTNNEAFIKALSAIGLYTHNHDHTH